MRALGTPRQGSGAPVAGPASVLQRNGDTRLAVPSPAMNLRHRARALAPVFAWVFTRACMVMYVFHELWARPSQRWVPVLISNFLTVDYFNYATKLSAGLAPYRSFSYEYPPGTLPFLAAGHWTSQVTDFVALWVAMMLVLDAITALVLWRWSRAAGRGALWLWVAALPLLGPLVLVRNDLIVACPFVAAGWLVATNRFRIAGAVWAFAVFAKLWPLAPFVMYTIARREGRRRFLTGALIVAAGITGWLAAWGVLGAMVSDLFMRHGHRPLEIETSWAITALLAAAARGVHLRLQFSYGSLNVVEGFPSWTPALAYRLTYLIELAGIAAVVALRWRHRARPPLNAVAWLTLAVVSGSLAAAPVLSPQYVLWLIAAACVVLACEHTATSRVIAVSVCAAAALTQLDYPVLFNHIASGRLDGLIVAETRNVLLAVIAVIATVAGVRRARSAGQGEHSLCERVG